MNRLWIVPSVAMVLAVLTTTAVWSQQRRVVQVSTSRPVVVPGVSLAVVVAPNNRDVWAYSKFSGLWHLQSLPVPAAKPIQPITGDTVAMFQAGSHLYAFSAPMGLWQMQDVEEGAKIQSQIMPDCCVVVTGTRAYGFSSLKGKWVVQDMRGP